jgi:DNA polymerase-3 subunit alpha
VDGSVPAHPRSLTGSPHSPRDFPPTDTTLKGSRATRKRAAHVFPMNDSVTAGFVHLHVHTEFSPLDGMTKIEPACAKVAADGQIALASTDHGNTSAAWQLTKYARKHKIKPLVGSEVYLAVSEDWRDEPDRTLKQSVEVDRDDDSADDDKDATDSAATKKKYYEHLTLFATTPEGWYNLTSMMDIAEETGFYSKPRIDYKLLKEHAAGIIVLTGCLGGPLLGPLSRGNEEQARRNLDRIIDAVGRENVYVEVMEHGIPAEQKAVPVLRAIAAEYDLPMVATNDAHYLDADDAEAHEAWLAVASGKLLADPKRYKFHGSGFHLRTEAEMRALNPEQWWQTACDNTVLVAGRFDDNVLPEAKLRLPQFPFPAPFRNELAYARHLARQGAMMRYPMQNPDDEWVMARPLAERLNFEIKLIDKQGFLSYFFIVEDLIRWAREDGNLPGWDRIEGGILVGPGRGSAAGSAFSYVLGIVDVDPLVHHLLFERFMEDERSDMPDIDVDFELQYVERVRAYLAWRWGEANVARIGTHNVALSKAAIKDAARVLDLTPIGNKLTKVLPLAEGGKPMAFPDLEDLENGAAEKYRSELIAAGPDGTRIVSLAKKMAGTLKGEGIHACGILISTLPLRGLVPLRRDRAKSTGLGLNMITAWDAPDVGDIEDDSEKENVFGAMKGGVGLLKLDVLSIRNLDIVALAVKYIEETTGEKIDPRFGIPNPDTKGDPRVQKTYALLKAGRTAGVFQMDGSGMQKVSRAVGPESLTDLSAIVALFRPGPLSAGMDELYAKRKSGELPVDYDQFTKDPAEQAAIASVLAETYGVWVFQEQLMRLGGVVAGFNGKQRNALRKAVSKKKKDVLAKVSAEFLIGAQQEHRDTDGNITSIRFSEQTALNLIEAMKGSASYLFNASHSAAYAQLAFTTAFLKANWPAEYGAAILATTSDKAKRLSAIEALIGEGIEILPPDVNLSRKVTAPAGDMKVRLGLAEIGGVGTVGEQVVAVREAEGIPFDSLESLIYRLTDTLTSKAASISGIEGIIDAGATSEFGPRLGQMMVARALKSKAMLETPDAEYSVLELSMRQRARIGLALGVHPVTFYKDAILNFRLPGAENYRGETVGEKPISIKRIPDKDGAIVHVAGLLSDWTESSYSKGQRANVSLENSGGARISGVMWDSDLKKVDVVPTVGSIVVLSAKVTMREREIEDEEGNVTETVITKELTVRSVTVIDVDDRPTGTFMEALASKQFSDDSALPEIPVLELLKAPVKPRKSAVKPPSAQPPKAQQSNASHKMPETGPSPASEPAPEGDAPAADAEPEPAGFADADDFISGDTPPYDIWADGPTDGTFEEPFDFGMTSGLDDAPDAVTVDVPALLAVTADVPIPDGLDEDESVLFALLGPPKEPLGFTPSGAGTPATTTTAPSVDPKAWRPRGLFASKASAK